MPTVHIVAPLLRRLNDGVDYPTFRRAWLPDTPDDPALPHRRVISAQSLADPQELLTLGLIEGEPEFLQGEYLQRLAAGERRRHDRIKDLVGPPLLQGVYQIVADDELWRPLRS